jgi:glycerophosphoryl diester phosphodiesterase
LVVNWLTQRPFAHRGLHGGPAGWPENSLAAFEAACNAGYGIELDTQLSRDGEVMVFHDPHLLALTGHDAALKDLTRDQLAELRLGGADQHIPSLEEVLDLVAGRAPLLLEVKNKKRRVGPLESAVAGILKSYAGDCAVISFNPLSVAWFAKHMPGLPRGQTASHFPHGNVMLPWASRRALKHLQFNKLSRPDFIVYDHRALTTKTPRRARRHCDTLLTFTIRTEEQLAYARRYADNVIFETVRP